MTKYILDTNLYIRAYRDRGAAAELERFYAAFTPASHLSSVVLHELLTGATTPAKAQQIQEEIARPFKRTGRVVAPSAPAWEISAGILTRLAHEGGLDLRRVSKSFVNDILLAVSCREAGATLITENERDFARIGKVVRFAFVPPWPA